MGYLSENDLQRIGFKKIGKNIKISDRVSIYGADRIEIGDNVRIDDFSILSAGEGGIKLGNYIHIACYCSLIGKERIILEDFSGLSSRVAIYSSSDDYSGKYLTNPTVPEIFTNVIHGRVHLEKHVIVGVAATLLPNIHIGLASAIGAYSLVTKDIEPHVIAAGVPAKKIKRRSIELLELETRLKQEAL